jgi:hypothetical protein
MSNSPLDLINSDGFRKKLITRNLVPYAKSPSRPSVQVPYEHIQSDLSVIDSPDQLIDVPSFANQLYPLNRYGNEGGYEQVPDPNGITNTISNQGEYGPGQQDAHIIDEGVDAVRLWRPLNAYADGLNVFDSAESFSSLDTVRPDQDRQGNGQPYPGTIVASEYSPLSILLSSNPTGSNGILSQDSYIARLGAITLRNEFQERIAARIRLETIGQANILNVNSGNDLLNIVTGYVPLLEPNWQITVPANPLTAAADFALRLGGSILPVSLIPGSYFDPTINPGQPTTIQQVTNAIAGTGVGNFFNQLLGGTQTGSQIFYNNTGAGQRSRLFKNIDYNKYKPNLVRGVFDRALGAITGTLSDNSNYYIGSVSSEPSRVFSPGGDLPVDQFGKEQQSPVYGPQELAQLYEGPSREVRLGANGPTYSNGGGIEGGFTWVSPKYKDNAGKKVGLGGVVTNQDEDFKPSSYNSTESTNIQLKGGSILDNTQRLINSQPQGGRRLQHVGNAIDQVSKVFHDGYKEITKGSRVYRYVGSIGQEVGTEYCRIFAKDLPYLQYNDLQKTDGITTSGRRFSNSVLDNTYNLNIVPNKQEGGQDSTNLIGGMNNGYAKKYMFSLENLAWRTSNTPGFSVADLAICERGPNGGRVMWFAPYGLTFSEQVQANWNPTELLGRPEPIYTYKSTSRGGTLNWKIVVDHPSALNVIVNKVLANETNKVRIDSILDSFFAGCRKYDLYELAKKYYTINPNDLFQLQEAISTKDLSKEQLIVAKEEIQPGDKAPTKDAETTSQSTGNATSNPNFDNYVNLGFYFGNDFPKKNQEVPNYSVEFNRYTSETNRKFYNTKPNASQTSTFFETGVIPNYDVAKALTVELAKQLEQNTGTVTIDIDSSCSAPASESYNRELSARRIQSTIKFFNETESLRKYITGSPQRLIIRPGVASGETATSQPIASKPENKGPYTIESLTEKKQLVNCGDGDNNISGGDTPQAVQVGSNDIFTVGAMSCRRSFISKITSTLTAPVAEPKSDPNPPPSVGSPPTSLGSGVVNNEPVVPRQPIPRDNITKRVLRALLSECDYFETIKAETPMVYDNLRDKLKFFQPAFHSTTPEGLNSRLTFLQQCMRPGDTIPTIKEINGSPQLQYNNATNTAFGAPPVLILRIGDFYNTKIIPNSLGIQYESLDINPEGIGIQPMIANVSLSFNFVGGSGLKESIDKLQNALTFNYYANTEIYDDRADVTDDSYKVFDEEFLKGQIPPGPPTINQAAVENGQSNNSTIGVVLTNEVTEFKETGTISYSDFMVKFKDETQTYFENVVNKNKETVTQYNNAVRQQWMVERLYTDGAIIGLDPIIDSEDITILFGKPSNLEKRFDKIFKELESDIQSGDDGFIKFMETDSNNFSRKVIRQLKQNYKNLVRNKRGVFENGITKIIQDITNVQQSYIQTIGRVNIMLFDGDGDPDNRTGTDGFQTKSGPIKIYITSGTTNVNPSSVGDLNTLDELFTDTNKINNGLKEFNTLITSETEFTSPSDGGVYKGVFVFQVDTKGKAIDAPTVDDVFIPFSLDSEFDEKSFRRAYMIISDDVIDDKKYEKFKSEMIGNIINNEGLTSGGNIDVESKFDNYWLTQTKPLFVKENNITKEFIEEVEKNKLKDYLNYTPFEKKERVLTYTTESASDDNLIKSVKNMISSLADTTNRNTKNNTWNSEDGVSFEAYISKVKLN